MFTSEFKTEIVEQCWCGDCSVNQMAGNLDLTEITVRNWGAQAEIDARQRNELTSSRA
ncbi:transposase [Streptosporangium sp. NPDC002721]|uniref:transposase n=1 Tax=Streptosporangium sp. NPDC002721 TaxID=3366188 RepID=UPI0036A761B5